MDFNYVKLNQLLTDKRVITVSPSLKLQSDDIKEEGNVAVVSQDQDFIVGYTELFDKKLNNPPFIVFGDHTEIFKYINFPFAQGADGIKILKADDKTIDSQFLYYALKNCYYPTGFYQRHFKLLKKTYVPDLSINHQKQIAKVLTNYDLLIANNNKRIKLLETMALSIYIEWFVRFRYPGYKNKKTSLQSAKGWTFGNRENGQEVPIGWSFDKLINIAEFKRGRNITAAEMIDGDIPVIAAGLSPSGYHNASNVKGKSITVSASGANAGFLNYHLNEIWAADCSYYQSDSNIWFVYNALKFLQPVITNMQVGSAQPHVYAKNLNRISTIIPPQETINLYVKTVKPFFEEIKFLSEKNNRLEQQRDMLLPRLMSNKVSVERKEIV